MPEAVSEGWRLFWLNYLGEDQSRGQTPVFDHQQTE